MGQTLSHGVYLPNEGERNCYAGLASNWQILNTAVGNIAEKAPLVHTHGNISNDGKVGTTANLPLITGTGGAITAGTFGNQANTFCEGNDSRLSDARTPVAHTHTKSDVTDLLNSNFIPSANNSYNLGSASYQWNNLYAKKTYTDTIKAVTGSIVIQSNGTDKNIGIYNGDSATDGGGFWAYGKDHSNGSLCRIQIYNTSKSRYERVDLANSQFFPASSGEIDLGTSTNKWKTLNGINPGALSLPGEYSSSVTEYVTDKTGGNNAYTAPADGWVGIQANSATLDSDNFIFMGRTSDGLPYFEQNASSPITAYWSNLYHGCILLPVIGGKTYGIRCKCDTVDARFYKANGNVS